MKITNASNWSIRKALVFLALALIGTISYAHPEEYQFLEKNGLKYVLYHPAESLLADGEVYPLVLHLHGSCPTCTTHEHIAEESMLKYLHNFDENTQPIPTFIVAPVGDSSGWISDARRNAIFAIIDELIETKPVDTRRIYITGYSMGAIGTWSLIQYRTNFFAAANPTGINPTGLNPQLVKDLPIWTTVGDRDTDTRVNGLISGVAAIRAANGDNRGALTWVTGVNPKFTIFTNTDHVQTRTANQNIGIKEWMYAQILDGNRTPTIRFAAPERFAFFQNGNSVPFEIVYSDPDGDELDISIAANGVIQPNALTSATKGTLSFPADGVYKITATATDAGGKSATATLHISVGIPITEVLLTSTGITLEEGSRRQEAIRVNRIGDNVDTSRAVDVNVSFSGTATFGVDYIASETLGHYKDGVVTIPVDETRGTIVLQVIDDLEDDEETETIVVTVQESYGVVFSEPTSMSADIINHKLEFASLFKDKTDVGYGIRDASDTGLGWVWDSHYPFVYAWKLVPPTSDGWIYIYPIGATKDGYFAWSFGAEQWFWTSFSYEGFLHFFGEGPHSGWIYLDSYDE